MDYHQQYGTELWQNKRNAHMLKKKTPDIPPITINDIQIEQVHNSISTISQQKLHDDYISSFYSKVLE